MAKVPNVRLNNGLAMPGFGLGTYKVNFNTIFRLNIQYSIYE